MKAIVLAIITLSSVATIFLGKPRSGGAPKLITNATKGSGRGVRRALIILGGPSTSGKSTLAGMLGFPSLVTVTTRKPRPGEQDGVHYYFIPVWKYNVLKWLGRIPERTVYAGVKYGIFKKTLEAVKKRDTHTIGVFDAKGVNWLRNYYGADNVLAIYVGVDEATMRRRLGARGSAQEEVDRRVAQALGKEMRPDYIDVYDEVIWNNDGTPIEATAEAILDILRKRGLLAEAPEQQKAS